MRGERLLALMVGVLCASPAWAERARPRGGGGGDDKTSRPAGGHHASGSRPSAPADRSSASSSAPLTEAQRRHPRAGTGTAYYRYGNPYYQPYYGGYYGGYYSPYYRPYRFYGYWGYPGYGYGGGYAPYGYGYGYAGYGYGGDRYEGSRSGALRVQVDPADAKVYVDGYYAGIVDDFDGIFQRLNVSPGRHEVSLKLEGHRTHYVRLYVGPDQTVKLRHRMVPGTGEDREEAVGAPADYARYEERGAARRDENDGAGRDDGDDEYAPPSGEAGTLRLDVRPDDATVYVDGEFRGEARTLRGLRLPAGRHRVEIVRPGYRTEEREVEVRPGGSADLAVDLERR